MQIGIKILSFLCSGCPEQLKYDYLMILYQVVDESTVCLMGHERRQTLQLIEDLRQAGLLTHKYNGRL